MAQALTVFSRPVDVVKIPAGHEVVSTARRSTKENKVAEADRYRAIFIPELSVSESGIPGKFATLVLDALRATATKQLAAMWEDATDGLTEVPAEVWGVDSLLAFADRVSQSQRLTKETIADWYKGSIIGKKAHDKGPKVFSKYEEGFTGIAGAVTFSEEKCTQLLALLAKESDCWQVTTMRRKLSERLEKLAEELADVDAFGDLDE